MDLTLILVSFFLSLAIGGLIYLAIELRRLLRQIRKMAQVYFPTHIEEIVDGEEVVTMMGTSVTLPDDWNEKAEPRD